MLERLSSRPFDNPTCCVPNLEIALAPLQDPQEEQISQLTIWLDQNGPTVGLYPACSLLRPESRQ